MTKGRRVGRCRKDMQDRMGEIVQEKAMTINIFKNMAGDRKY